MISNEAEVNEANELNCIKLNWIGLGYVVHLIVNYYAFPHSSLHVPTIKVAVTPDPDSIQFVTESSAHLCYKIQRETKIRTRPPRVLLESAGEWTWFSLINRADKRTLVVLAWHRLA